MIGESDPLTCSAEKNPEDMQLSVQKFPTESDNDTKVNGPEKSELSTNSELMASNDIEKNWKSSAETVEENMANPEGQSEFLPTIVDIRGSCSNDLDCEVSAAEGALEFNSISDEVGSTTAKSEPSGINIIDVQGNLNLTDIENTDSKPPPVELENSEKLKETEIYSVDDDSDSASEKNPDLAKKVCYTTLMYELV